MTEILAEMVKLTHKLTLLTLGGHVEIKPITIISETVSRETKKLKNEISWITIKAL